MKILPPKEGVREVKDTLPYTTPAGNSLVYEKFLTKTRKKCLLKNS